MANPKFDATARRLGAAIEVASGAASTPSAAVSAGCLMVRISCTAACRIAIGAAPTATATGTLLQPLDSEYFLVEGGDKVAVIQEAAPGKVSITEVTS